MKGVYVMILRANSFCKRATCPSSENLLAYQACNLAAEQTLWIESHLDECDFCGAEYQLLSEHVPAKEEECALVDMPSNLRFLAQSLLSANCHCIESFSETVFDKARLTLTDA